MSIFCQHLNLNIQPLQVHIDELPNDPWTLVSLDLINPELKTLFEELNLTLMSAALFVLQEGESGPVHADGKKLGDYAKINWSYNTDHVMNWYKEKTNEQHIFQRESDDEKITSRPYVSYNNEDVDLISSEPIGFPSIVQVGVPHNVTNLKGIRKCVSIALVRDSRFISMDNAIETFKNYI